MKRVTIILAFLAAVSWWLVALLATERHSTSAGCQCACSSCCTDFECVRVHSPKTIKKVVYDARCVPVCEHRPAKFLAGCDCCPICELQYKKVLLKREIVVCETCATRCVPRERTSMCVTLPQETDPAYSTPSVPAPPAVSVAP